MTHSRPRSYDFLLRYVQMRGSAVGDQLEKETLSITPAAILASIASSIG